MMPVTKRILVIGGVAAGPSAASKAARTRPDVQVTLFEQTDSISYGICEIPYFLAGEVRAEDLVVHTPGSLGKEKGVEVRTLQRVESISPTRRSITVRELSGGRIYEERYDRLVIATGAKPRLLNLAGENGRNVFTVRSFDGAIALRSSLDSEHPRRAVIIGGGYIGIEVGEALRLRGCEVTILERRETILGDMDISAQNYAGELLASHGVTVLPKSQVVGLPTDQTNRVTHVLTSDGTFAADLVIVAAGIIPDNGLASAAGIRLGKSGGILTDQRQQTSVEGIFAAGDCCEYRDIITRRPVYAPLATNGNRAGWVAGENAAGGRAFFPGVLRSVALRVFEGQVARVGLSAHEAQEAGFHPVSETINSRSRVAVMPGSVPLGITLTAERESGRILGGALWGTEGAVLRSHALALAIQQGLTLEQFQKTDFAYTPSFAPLWDPLLVAANVLEKARLRGTRP
jgi:NADPH-dependent 2,4-dienoyl-CoA reductase/sulfur reductase-like enzyme